MQKNGSLSREKSSTLVFMTVTSLGAPACEATVVEPFMLPLSSMELSGVVGLHWPKSLWGSWPFTPLRTSLVSSGFTDWSWSPWVHCPSGSSVSLCGGGGDGNESDLEMPLDKWEEPFKQLFVYSFSEELLREIAGLFWVGEEVGFGTEAGFTLMGRRSSPEATRFSMRPPRISIAPVRDEESLYVLYFYHHSHKKRKYTRTACSLTDLSHLPCQAYWSRSSWVNGARAKVKPIPERPIAYAVANLFRKYSAVTTEKDWYSSAKPIPNWIKESKSQGCGQTRGKFNLKTSNRCLHVEDHLGLSPNEVFLAYKSISTHQLSLPCWCRGTPRCWRKYSWGSLR